MSPTGHLSTEQRIELALSTLNQARKDETHPPTYQELALDYEVPRSSLWHRDHGRIPTSEHDEQKQYLTVGEEEALVNWCLEMQDYCFAPRISLLKEMAVYLYSKRNPEKPRPVGCNWHLSFLDRHPQLGIKYSRQIEHVRVEAQQDYFVFVNFFERLEAAILKYNIAPENLYNLDEIGYLMGFTQSCRVIYGKDLRQRNGALRACDGGREMVTVIETICADGSQLLPMIIFKGDGVQESWVENTHLCMPDGVLVGYSENGWTDGKKSLRYLEHFFGSNSSTASKATSGTLFRMLLFDGHSSHVTWEFLLYCLQHRIIPFCLPAHTTHKLQPLDVAVFSPLKRKWSEAVWERFQWGNHIMKKESFWEVLLQARAGGLTEKNILSGFEATGIYPLNAQKLLQTLPGYDSYRPNPEKPTASPPPYEPRTPKTESEISKLEGFAESKVCRNTPRSRDARSAIRFLAHSASFYCSTLNLRDETERKKQQYLIEEGLNSGRKGRKRIKIDNSAISAGDVKKVIQANYDGKEKTIKTSLDYYTRLYTSTSTKITEIASKLKQQQEREKNGRGSRRYKCVVQLEIEQKELEEKLEKYKWLMKEKKLEYQKLGMEKKNALGGVENLDIEYGESERERPEEEEHLGVEVEDDENTC